MKKRNLRAIENINVSAITNFNRVFTDAVGILDLDLSKWDVGQGLCFDFMFYHSEFSGKGIENWNMKNAFSLKGMFEKCVFLNENVDLSNWNVRKVESFKFMFLDSNFKGKGIEYWELFSVKELNYIFYNCDLSEDSKRKLCFWKEYIDNYEPLTENFMANYIDYYDFYEKFGCEKKLAVMRLKNMKKQSLKDKMKLFKQKVKDLMIEI